MIFSIRKGLSGNSAFQGHHGGEDSTSVHKSIGKSL